MHSEAYAEQQIYRFFVHTHVDFTRLNKIEAMFGREREHVKVELRSNLTFTRDLSYIAFIFPKMFLPVL